jgi:hypothetical protein
MSAPAKTIEVDPTEEGPKVRPKRQMTEAQLAALKKGREKLAEKRKLQDHETKTEPKEDAETTRPTEKTEHVQDSEEDEANYAPLCRIM